MRRTAGAAPFLVVLSWLALLALPAGAASAASAPAAPGTSHDTVVAGVDVDAPVYDGDAPDPDVIRVGSTYYAYTTGSDLRNIPVLESTDLEHWQPVGDALPVLPAWSTFGQTWAPGVVEIGGHFVMYYATEVADDGAECISEAVASAPTGPFSDTSAGPLVCQVGLGGSIDPDPFVDGDGTLYLYWKSNSGTSALPATIWGAQLTPDGSALASGAYAVLTQDEPWETTLEAPAMVEEGGAHVLFFSGGLWDSAGYGVGYASCAGPLGPCTTPDATPVVHSDAERLGPGGESLVQDPSGQWWMAYHAWDGPSSDYAYADGDVRSLWMAAVDFEGGVPVVEAGQPAEGYRLVAGDGGVFPYGAAAFDGSMGGRRLAAPVVGGASDPATGGYWLVASDGGVFAYDAPFLGSTGGRRLAAPVVGMAATPDGRGYWLVGSDGGVFAFGDAPFLGSTGATPLGARVTALAAMPQGGGYWVVAADGDVLAFGNAENFGWPAGVRLAAPVVALLPGPGSGGYWLVAADGGVFAFGDAAFEGSGGGVHLAAAVVGGSALGGGPG
ncbi:MAG TPA: glycoside hydrolase family 43 protein [Acidimicrobiales bacterium]|nr:glycoside hydrolase family 43 protein [Acidimicrobiales bacterium]